MSAHSVFVSYRHTAGAWVLDRLVPCLKAGQIDVRIDVERFRAGRALVGQMDAQQDAAERQLLVLTADYFQSDYCVHEFQRALARDAQFQGNVIVPVLRDGVDWRKHIAVTDPPLLADLRADGTPANAGLPGDLSRQWSLLLDACGAELRSDALDWLRVRDEVLRHIQRAESVNLVADPGTRWAEMLDDLSTRLQAGGGPALGVVDLERGEASARRPLVELILKKCGLPPGVPNAGEELAVLAQRMAAAGRSRLAFCHFDLIRAMPYCDVSFFGTLKHLMMDHVLENEPKRLVLLIHSHAPYSTLLPTDHPITTVALTTVELRGRRT